MGIALINMPIYESTLATLWLTLQLATLTTVILIVICTPLAWWLSRTESFLRAPVSALIALPIVLPPTVLGFYLLVMLAPSGFIGVILEALGIGPLPFSFSGLVVASIIYSLPFVVQPLTNAFSAIGERPLEVAASLGAKPIDAFFSIVIPQARTGYLAAAILGFAHTLGEFGVVLMIGGNIPGETRVISVQLYEHVEALEFAEAHTLAGIMLALSFSLLLALFCVNHGKFGANRRSNNAF